MAYTIDGVKKLFSDRAGTRGISSNVTPDKFNRWLPAAELKFFNQNYAEYAKRQTISDSISKWMTDALYLPIPSSGKYQFPTGFNLLHVDSMSGYIPAIGGVQNFKITGGSGYTNGTYTNVPLTGGTGKGATASATVTGNTVTAISILNAGIDYTTGDVLTAVILGGTGFSLLVSPNGQIGSANLSGGSAYTNGTYTNIPLTGGTGAGATISAVVAGGVVVSYYFTSLGEGYSIGDDLQQSTIPVGTGFSLLVTSLTNTKTYKCKRVEKNRVSANLSSEYDAPTREFPIYTQFSNSFQFYPINIGTAQIVYLQQPVWSYWGYNLAGYIATTTGLAPGSSYTNGVYNNVPLTGGSGNGALATITVAGSVVTSVVLTAQGKLYQNGDTLGALAANVGGTGTGFHITVSSLVAGSIRAVYDPTTSVQPLWNDDDISTIVDLALFDASIASRDSDLNRFAKDSANSIQ